MSNEGEMVFNSNKKLDQINEKLNTIFNTKVEHIIQNQDDKVTEIKFTLPQGNENPNDTILELLNLYVIPAFVLPSDRRNKDISIKVKNRQETFILKRRTKVNNTYIDSKQITQQSNSEKRPKHGIEEIEFIEINKDKFNFDFNSSTNTEVEITFASSEINIKYIEEVLKCVSNFKKLTENEPGKSIIEVNHHQLTTESKDKLNIYPFFAKKIKGNESEIVFCLTSNQNKAELVSSIFGGGQDKFEIDYGQEKYPFFSYNLDHTFSLSLVSFLQFFNDQSHNEKAKISNLKKIEKQFIEKIKIKDSQEKEEESKNSDEVEIKIENMCLPLKNLIQEGKICFYFDVKVGNGSDQIENESKHIYETAIYKITSLISLLNLCLNQDKFSISIEIDGKNINTINESSIGKIFSNYYLELTNKICNGLKDYAISLIKPKDYNNPKPLHVQVLDLFYTKKVSFRLEVECQKIKLNNLNNIESLVSVISILNAHGKAFSDTIDNPSVRCYLSNFFRKNDNQISYVYVVTHLENSQMKNSQIIGLFKESFSPCFSDFKQIQNDNNILYYSMTIDIDKLLNNPINEPKAVQNIEVTEELKITEEGTDAKPQSQIEYDVNWQDECFCKIGDANDYDALEQNFKEASKFVHKRLVYVCEQLLKKINTLQKGREQSPSQQFLTIDKSTAKQYRTTLNENIKNYSNFINKKKDEFDAIKLNFNKEQRSSIGEVDEKFYSAFCDYKEMAILNLFISKNGTRLPEVLKENVEELEQLIEKITFSKLDELVEEVTKNTTPQSGTDNFTTDEIAGNKLLDNTQDSDPVESNSPELDVNETGQEKETENLDTITVAEENLQQSNDDEKQEINTAYIYQLFQKLSSKLDEWENLGQSSQNDQDQTITNLFQNLTSKIENCITQRKKNSDEKIVERYKKMQNHVKIIYYSDSTRAETAIHNIVGLAFNYLKKEELKDAEVKLEKKAVQIEQETNREKMGNELAVSIVRGVLSLCNKCKDAITPAKKKTAEPNDEVPYKVYEPAGNTSYGYGCQTQNSNTRKSCYNSSNDYNYSSASLPCNQSFPSPELSNLKKCKGTLKTMFSEKENYVFLISPIIGVGAILGYFVPGRLRDLVPPEKQKGIDVTIAVSASIVIILCFAALIHSAYATIKIPNRSQPVQQNGTNYR